MPNAIITGGNSGIGRATAVALAAAGFDVGFTWHAESERAASAVRGDRGRHGRRAEARQVDLHDGEAGARVVEELADALGSVDCFVSNAGYGTSASVLETTAEGGAGSSRSISPRRSCASGPPHAGWSLPRAAAAASSS